MSRLKVYNQYKSFDSRIFDGDIDGYTIPVEVRTKLAKDLGFSYDLYSTLDAYVSKALVESVGSKSRYPDVTLLLDNESKEVLGYTLDTSRVPILNTEFVKIVKRLVSTTDVLEVSDIYIDEDSTTSSIVLKRSSPIVLEEKHTNRDSDYIEYQVGVYLYNSELDSSSCRLVLYINNQPIYLPSSFYNSSTTRYKRSTSNSMEALEVMMLKIIEDMKVESLQYRIQEAHIRYRYNKNLPITYEEYNYLLNTMRKIPTIIENTSYLESLTSLYEDFEKKYNSMEDKKSSYIWRCTAMGNITVGSVVNKACAVLGELYAPEVEISATRDLLGYYISTPRILNDIAKDSSV